MMKKLFFLLAVGALGVQANAQNVVSPSGKNLVYRQPVPEYNNLVVAPNTNLNSAAKGTSVGNSRWYVPFDVIDFINGGALEANLTVLPIWFDSTVKQRFNTGLGTINFSSVSQIIDPIGSQLFNDETNFPDGIRITSTTPYKVDSISIFAAYVRMPTRPANIVDTLIISVINNTGRYFWRSATDPWISNYTANDTLYAGAPLNEDSVNRAAFGEGSSPVRFFQKIPLTAAMGDAPDPGTGNLTLRNFVFPVNGAAGLSIPAGNMVGITATFKSGDSWTINVDSVTKFHRFMPVTAPVAENANMPYDLELYNDRSMSGLMFSTDTSFYAPSIAVEGTNQNSFRQEYHAIGAFLSCATCAPVTVKQTAGMVSELSDAYPNPAHTQVSFNYTLKEAAVATATITNTVGQVVMTQQLPKVVNGKATFDVSNLSNGLYFYTIEANGQRLTSRVVITH